MPWLVKNILYIYLLTQKKTKYFSTLLNGATRGNSQNLIFEGLWFGGSQEYDLNVKNNDKYFIFQAWSNLSFKTQNFNNSWLEFPKLPAENEKLACYFKEIVATN